MCWTSPHVNNKQRKQTTGGKDELNIVFIRNSYRTSQQGSRNSKDKKIGQHAHKKLVTYTRLVRHLDDQYYYEQ